MSVFRTHHRKCEGCGNLFTPKTLQGNRETQQWKCDECKGKPEQLDDLTPFHRRGAASALRKTATGSILGGRGYR